MKMWEGEKEGKLLLPYAEILHSTPGIKTADIELLLDYFGDCGEIYRAKQEELQKIIGDKKTKSVVETRQSVDLGETIEKMERDGIHFVCMQSPEYPKRLREIPDPPFGLYILGGLPEDTTKSVAIVGARNCSPYGAHMAAELGREMAGYGVQVISGMAKGIDGISQQAALNAGGRSFGVLGSGVDVCYPASNRGLYRHLAGQGGVLSEYPMGSLPRPERFPQRNRIISGLSDVVIVVEAKQKSGTLITVDMALEQGREIYCVPGRITDKLSEGCNRLIGQGAGIYLSTEDFFERTGILMGKFTEKEKGKGRMRNNCEESLIKEQLDEKEYALWKLLDYEPVSMEQLYIQLVSVKGMGQVSMQEMMGMLTKLVLLDRAENVGGCHYAKKG